MRVLYVSYALWKSVAQAQGFSVFHFVGEQISTGPDRFQLKIWAGDKDIVYHADVDTEANYDDWEAAFASSTQVPSEDEAIANITGLGKPLVRRQADGTPLTAPTGRYGKEVIYATHNLTDKTTWYGESSRVTDEVLSDSGDGLTFNSANDDWIDMVHGKVFDEEGLIEDQQLFNPGDPHGYLPVVKVDGVTMEERSGFETSGGDYTINYATGDVTFFVSQAGKSVTASYSHAATSGWLLTPLPGKALVIEKAEVQFSKDIQMEKAFVMEIYGLADIFAPHLLTTADPPGPLPPGTPIPIEGTVYKTIDQLIDEAVLALPEIPVLGGVRGYTQPRHVFQFHYAAVRTIWSSLGMFIRISMDQDAAFTGERATATFYCLSQSDPGVTEALALLTAE